MTKRYTIRFGAVRRAAARLAVTPQGSGFLTLLARSWRLVLRLFWRLGRLLGLHHLIRLLRHAGLSIARSVFGFVYRHRRRVKSRAAVASDFAAAVQNSDMAAAAVYIGLRLYEAGVPLLPRLVFSVVRQGLVLVAGAHLAAGQVPRGLSAVRVMNLLFRTQTANGHRPCAHLYFEVLHRASLQARIAREASRMPELDDFYLNRTFGIAYLNQGPLSMARRFLQRAIDIYPFSYLEHRLMGQAYVSEGKYGEAARAFRRSVAILPPTVMAHQNYAGRYDVASYKPKAWELKQAGELLVYDNLCQLAEDQFLRGEMELSFRYYQRMLDYQREIAKDKSLPRKLLFPLWLEHDQFDADMPVRILPYEWVTQFGHIGLLDSVVKMRKLGMLPPANYVLLAPAEKTANEHYLSYWDEHFCIVRDPELIDQLFPYQRYFGENFMAYPADGPVAEPWTRAAARAQYAWAKASRPPLLQLSDQERELGEEMLEVLGVEKGAWYVGLHVREGGFHAESSEGISKHRNARLEDYYPAIHEITSRGGYVIRLGDPSMRALPTAPGVIDYAYSPHRSPQMDLFFLATSRFIIGTTSGLTTVALSFGAPMLLVNCISNDWQLWTDTADFMVKKVYDRRGQRSLSLAETYRPPRQGYLINNIVLERQGYSVEPNSPEEILAAVRYKLDVLIGRRLPASESDPLMVRYRKALSNNAYMFGAARPVLPFLEMNPELLNPDPDQSARTVTEQWTDRVDEFAASTGAAAQPEPHNRRLLSDRMQLMAGLGSRSG